ncbi:MAG: flagellar basal body P-ring formation chaperone FlgA [Gammaproteobacteria bacterium]|nr:flagellar basal body P-ring formation chaperone FlgA [Gammaproteobacteria bacterium]
MIRFAGVALSIALLAIAPTVPAAELQSTASIRDAAARFLRAQHARSTVGELQVKVDALDPRLRLPKCPVALQTFLPPGGRALGNTAVGIRCTGAHPWTLYVPAQVALYGKVLVAARALTRGTTLTSDDFRLARRDLNGLAYGYLTNPKTALGKRALRLIPAGAALTPNTLAFPPLVRRGQQVTLVAGVGGLEVRMAGTALADGANGADIKVRNLSSKRVVEGTVVATGVVRVPL